MSTKNNFSRIAFGLTNSPFLFNRTVAKKMQKDIISIMKVDSKLFFDYDFVGVTNSLKKAYELFKKIENLLPGRILQFKEMAT